MRKARRIGLEVGNAGESAGKIAYTLGQKGEAREQESPSEPYSGRP